jgi:hypothetical protein
MASSVVSFADLLRSAVTDPGVISSAYSQFHQYSFGNQLLAMVQCLERGIRPGPMATFPKWKELGRHVRKGEKAITLCQPVAVRRPTDVADDPSDSDVFVRFVYKPHWFVLAQTDGSDIEPAPLPTWDVKRALTTLDVQEVPFEAVDGNCLGYALARTVAINPVNPMPQKTRFHELAHVLLGHTSEGMHADSEITPRNLRECEAESVALLCLAALRLAGVEHCRGYIQAWWGAGNPIPERSAQRILKAADQIIKAGRTQTEAL